MMERMALHPKTYRALALLCVGALVLTREAQAVCKEPLPAADLHSLDALATADPISADRQARAALGSASEPTRRAQLHAILADAHNTTGEDQAALQDVRDGRAQLAAAGSFEGAERIGLRLALVEADAAHNREELLAAVSGLDLWREVARAQPIGRACLLLVRSRVLSRLGMHEQSARDGLEAHAIAIQSGSEDAVSETHFQLANAFRGAGLFEQAIVHVDASLALARSRREAASQSSAAYLKGQILGDSGRVAEAHAIMQESRRISLDLGDASSAGFADLGLCDFELQLGRVKAARQSCQAARGALSKAGRRDMVAVSDSHQARLDMAEGRPAAALRRLSAILRDGGKVLPPYALAGSYRVLADAHTKLRQPAQAASALQRFLAVEEADHQKQRSLAAALTLAQFDRMAQERRAAELSREVRVRGEQARVASLSRQRAWTLLAGSALIISLLLALLAASRRNVRVLSRQEALLKAASEHSPDSIALLTADGRVRFASRDLFGRVDAPRRHGLLIDTVPASLQEDMREILSRLLEDGVAVERDLRVEAGDAQDIWRDIELRANPIWQADRLIGATVRTVDVTTQRAMARAALEWLDRQREKAGGGLHEGLAQELAGVSMRLGAMVSAQRSGKTVAPDTLETSIAQLSGAIEVTRNLASDLSPMVTGRGSLQDALSRLASEASLRSGVPVRFAGDWGKLPELGRAGELLYRIAELALLGPGVKSGPGAVTLKVENRPEGIHLVLEAESGLMSMDPQILQLIRYLATLLGASTHLEPLDEQGWRLRVAVPRSGFSR
jgi:tetratricopeptide (TPR) repeat protein